MYSKQQASHLRQEFWTAFGKYMQPVVSSSGEKVNWINYKTGAKHLYFRMQAAKGATVSIEITHPDESQRLAYYEKLLQLQEILQSHTGEAWHWDAAAEDDTGKIISRVQVQLNGVNVFNKADWPALISFFKPRIMALDAFWNDVKHVFDVW